MFPWYRWLFEQDEYERKINILIGNLRKRLRWLREGTKALFGELSCDNVCIVVDVSDSMDHKLEEVRKRLQALLREQVWLQNVQFYCDFKNVLVILET